MRDYRKADLSAADRAMLDFAMELTEAPAKIERGRIDDLREAGFSDLAIHDIVQITGLFAYYNRLADGLGIDLEDDFEPAPPGD